MISFDLCTAERAKVRYMWVVSMESSLGGNDTLVTYFEFSKCCAKWSPRNCIYLCPLELETCADVLASCLVSICMVKGWGV